MSVADVRRRGRGPFPKMHHTGAPLETFGGGVDVPIEGGVARAPSRI